jgi:hypothetical protein
MTTNEMTLVERLNNPQYREPVDTDLIVLDTERTTTDMRDGALALEGHAVLRCALINDIRRLTEILSEANEVCRSAHSIAERDGAETNWEAFRSRLALALANQHSVLHGGERIGVAVHPPSLESHPISEWIKEWPGLFTIKHADEKVSTLQRALVESVKLQSHYAGLLNQYDGGKRLQFRSGQEWIERINQTNTNGT